jgi:hypothetical protein
MHALGVASTKFVELESVLYFLFGTLFSLGRDDQIMVVAKIGDEAALTLMQQKLERLDWPPNVKELIVHFIDAFNICNENRAALAHSGVAWAGPFGRTLLFKTTKKGKAHGAAPKLAELRRVADDINRFCDYGRSLGNAINQRLASDPPWSPGGVFPLPHKLPSPHKLEFRAGPFALEE